jgi:hypothetical protein
VHPADAIFSQYPKVLGVHKRRMARGFHASNRLGAGTRDMRPIGCRLRETTVDNPPELGENL